MKRTLRIALPILLAMSPFFVASLFGQGAESPQPQSQPTEGAKTCLGCHAPEADMAKAVNVEHFLASPHAKLDCTDCHTEFTAETPHTDAMFKSKAACQNCHDEPASAYVESVHARKDKIAGDHPTCVTCHGGGDPHGVHIRGQWTREQKAKVCSECHANTELMARYGPNIDAVSSYNHSFHGKALLRFNNLKTAICSDCHGMHEVREPTDPKSPTHANNAAKTCAQSGCHPGATMHFAMSGANHIELKIHESPFLSGVLWFFRILVIGMTGFLLMGVFLDMRMSIFGKHPPRCGRSVGFLIAMGFLSIVVAILLAAFNQPGALTPTLIGAGLLTLSLVVYRLETPAAIRHENQRMFHRLSLSLRVQHFVLMISFTLLIVTGMPVRQSDSDVLRNFYMMIGGLEVGRWIHRIAGVMLISVFAFHVLELIWKWKKAGFSFKSWTMLPTKKDVSDFVQTSKYYAGLTENAPKYGRFQFREKLDYFAEYWGIPLMGFTGLVLWFPVFFSTYMPEETVSVATIAHSYEAVLAFLAILTWHMYNTHFNPTTFPMNPSWWTGKMPESAMRHEHPLEMEEILAKEGTPSGPVEEPLPQEPVSDTPAEPKTPPNDA